MQYLVRIHQPQRDKLNVIKNTFSEALKLLNKTEEDITLKVKGLTGYDIFFKDTKDYIREVKN